MVFMNESVNVLQDFLISVITTLVITFLVPCIKYKSLKGGLYIWKNYMFVRKESGIPRWVFVIGTAFGIWFCFQIREAHFSL